MRWNAANAAAKPVVLTEEFYAAADPRVNFTGERVLFSARKLASDRWQIWEMKTDGSEKRQVTNCETDCLRGAYLPGEEIAVTVVEHGGERETSHLATARMDGSQLQAITVGPAPFELETVLRDGRIVASAPWPLTEEGAKSATRMLYTLRPNGTALESFRCEHAHTAARRDAAELEDGSLVYVMDEGEKSSGRLAEVKRGALQEARIGEMHAAYASPQQVSAEQLLVSRQTMPGGRFDLYLMPLTGAVVPRHVYADEKLSSVQAVSITGRAVPKKYWSTLNPDSPSGYFISLDSRISADAADGSESKPIAHVRVFAQEPGKEGGRLLGEAPVEADGSFYVEVPANLPVRFELVTAKGELVRAEHSWVWTRPGEQRGCAGCHGDKSVAPENQWPLTLKRFDTPTPLGIERKVASSEQPR